jgi:hypothetical protein
MVVPSNPLARRARWRPFGIGGALALAASLWGGFAVAEPPAAVVPQKVEPLFNGRNLAGWSTWLVDARRDDPRRVFRVADGAIQLTGDGRGYLRTERAYRDYRLVVEFRWGERNWGDRVGRARDSGLFLHAVGPDGNSYDGGGAYMAGLECQIMQGAVGDLLLIKGRDEAGRDVPVRLTAATAPKRDADGWPWFLPEGWPVSLRATGRLNQRFKDPNWQDRLDFRGTRDVEGHKDHWTRLEVLAQGSAVRVHVNGQLVNAATEVFPTAGHILLQCEGSEVFFRRVELQPLER